MVYEDGEQGVSRLLDALQLAPPWYEAPPVPERMLERASEILATLQLDPFAEQTDE